MAVRTRELNVRAVLKMKIPRAIIAYRYKTHNLRSLANVQRGAGFASVYVARESIIGHRLNDGPGYHYGDKADI